MNDWNIMRLAQNEVDSLLAQEFELKQKIAKMQEHRLELELGLCAAFERLMRPLEKQ